MIKRMAYAIALLLTLSGGACAATFTDALGRSIVVSTPRCVVSLYGSFAEAWLLAGGSLTGATEDAVSQRNLVFDDDVQIVGSVKTPNLELLLALEPDFVILSADIPSQAALDTALEQAEIPHAYFRVDDYRDYLGMLRFFCDVTGRDDLYKQNGACVEMEIEDIIDRVPKDSPAPTVLLLRAYSSGFRIKGSEESAGITLKRLGAVNIAEREGSSLTDLGLEEIMLEDPDVILIVAMGDEREALAALESGLMRNPAWMTLGAVTSGRAHVLPRELFHYKPNARWAESYAMLAKILYPDAY